MVVAGLLTAHAESPVARILDGMLRATFGFVLSEAMLAEYRAVLLRPRLVKRHGLSVTEIDSILTDIARHAIVMTPIGNATTPRAPDPGDQFLWNLLVARANLVLVTGDKLLLQDEMVRSRVMLPNTFVDLL